MSQYDMLVFKEIELKKISPDAQLPGDLFLRINDKYIKYLHKEDELSGDKFNLFIAKGVTSIFVQDNEHQDYLDWINAANASAEEKMIEAIGEENSDLIEKREQVKERVFEVFEKEDLTKENVQTLCDQVEEFVDVIRNRDESQDAIASLLKFNTSIAEHSVNVANIAVFMAMAIGQSHEIVLENVYLGALLHDYGKIKIPAKILEDTQSHAYHRSMNEHPMKGVALLKKTKSLRDPVYMIIAQHHEQHNGEGYPQGLLGEKTYQLAKVVGIANSYEHVLMANKNRPIREQHKLAIKLLEYDKAKQFDPELTALIIPALKRAVGRFMPKESVA